MTAPAYFSASEEATWRTGEKAATEKGHSTGPSPDQPPPSTYVRPIARQQAALGLSGLYADVFAWTFEISNDSVSLA